jgi:hypothetical protein
MDTKDSGISGLWASFLRMYIKVAQTVPEPVEQPMKTWLFNTPYGITPNPWYSTVNYQTRHLQIEARLLYSYSEYYEGLHTTTIYVTPEDRFIMQSGKNGPLAFYDARGLRHALEQSCKGREQIPTIKRLSRLFSDTSAAETIVVIESPQSNSTQ